EMKMTREKFHLALELFGRSVHDAAIEVAHLRAHAVPGQAKQPGRANPPASAQESFEDPGPVEPSGDPAAFGHSRDDTLTAVPASAPLRALLVSYAFPPTGGAGVTRILKLAQYLPLHGVRPAVLTVANPSVPVLDASLEERVPAELEVVRA